jgi:hypothetical protein
MSSLLHENSTAHTVILTAPTPSMTTTIWGSIGHWLQNGLTSILSPIITRVTFTITEQHMAAEARLYEQHYTTIKDDKDDNDNDDKEEEEEEEAEAEEEQADVPSDEEQELNWLINMTLSRMHPPPTVFNRALALSQHITSSSNSLAAQHMLYSCKTLLYNQQMGLYFQQHQQQQHQQINLEAIQENI